jgi:hypothetical protein
MGIGSAESILSEANVPRNDTAYRIAALPSVARNDVNVTTLNGPHVSNYPTPECQQLPNIAGVIQDGNRCFERSAMMP